MFHDSYISEKGTHTGTGYTVSMLNTILPETALAIS